jgi:PAS domain S-box-containing protein
MGGGPAADTFVMRLRGGHWLGLAGSHRLAAAGVAGFAVVPAVAGMSGSGGAALGIWRFLLISIVLFAFAYGLRGGLAAAGAAVCMSAIWYLAVHSSAVSGIDLLLRSLNYVVAGAIVGRLVDSRARALGALSRHVELSSDVIVAGSDGLFDEVNPAFTKVLGHEAKDVVGRSYLEFVHPEDREKSIAVEGDVSAGRGPIRSFENRYRHRDGSYRWLEWSINLDVPTQKRFAFGRDITERKRAEERERNHLQILERAVQDRTRKLEDKTTALEEARLDTLQRLAMAGEYHDEDTYLHTERVGKTAALIARKLGSTGAWEKLIRRAAPLHDLGKLAVSDSILLKSGPLTDTEWIKVKNHPTVGATILAGSNSAILQLAEEIALTHHEWWDGSGYPAGLIGHDIPLSGRIVALADTFDALTHDRPYKAAWPIERAVTEIQRLSGHKFDPEVVEAFNLLDARELAGEPTEALPILAPHLRRHALLATVAR